jgi:hypothetical protein
MAAGVQCRGRNKRRGDIKRVEKRKLGTRNEVILDGSKVVDKTRCPDKYPAVKRRSELYWTRVISRANENVMGRAYSR